MSNNERIGMLEQRLEELNDEMWHLEDIKKSLQDERSELNNQLIKAISEREEEK